MRFRLGHTFSEFVKSRAVTRRSIGASRIMRADGVQSSRECRTVINRGLDVQPVGPKNSEEQSRVTMPVLAVLRSLCLLTRVDAREY